MANTYTTRTDVSEDILIDFQYDAVIANTSFRRYEKAVIGDGWDKGGLIRIPLPLKYDVSDGPVIASVPAIVEKYTTLTLDYRRKIPMEFTTQDMTTNSKFKFKERFITPAGKALSANIEQELATQMFKYTYLVTGTPGVAPASYQSIASVRTYMNKMMIRRDGRWLGFSEDSYESTISTTNFQNSFDKKLTKDINREAQLGRIAQFQSYSTPLFINHIAGKGLDSATPANGKVAAGTVKTTITSGNTMTITGLTASSTGVFQPGDKLEFDNVFHIDPITKTSVGRKFSVSIIDSTAIDADSGGDAVITFYPTLDSSATSVFRNISSSAGIIATTPVTLYTGNTTAAAADQTPYEMNFGYVPEAVVFAAPPLAMPDGIPTKDMGRFTDPETDVSIRLYAYTNGDADNSRHRLDMLFGILINGDRIVGLFG